MTNSQLIFTELKAGQCRQTVVVTRVLRFLGGTWCQEGRWADGCRYGFGRGEGTSHPNSNFQNFFFFINNLFKPGIQNNMYIVYGFFSWWQSTINHTSISVHRLNTLLREGAVSEKKNNLCKACLSYESKILPRNLSRVCYLPTLLSLIKCMQVDTHEQRTYLFLCGCIRNICFFLFCAGWLLLYGEISWTALFREYLLVFFYSFQLHNALLMFLKVLRIIILSHCRCCWHLYFVGVFQILCHIILWKVKT